MRKPSDNELKCIQYARNMYPPRFKKKSIIQKFFFLQPNEVVGDFKIKNCIVYEEKSLRTLWEMYGLEWQHSIYDIHGNHVERSWGKDRGIIGEGIPREFQNKFFSEEENIKCINYWIKVLYKKKIDLSAMLDEYKLKISNTIKKQKEESLRNNTLMVRTNFHSPVDNLIYSLDHLLGYYD